jgi:hypothetical protein
MTHAGGREVVGAANFKAGSRALIHAGNLLAALVLSLTMLSPRAVAQVDEFLPEVDFNYKLASEVRASFQARSTREGGEATMAEIGPSIAFYMKPLLKLKTVALFDLDDSKSRPLVFAIGYRYLPSPGSPAVNRLEPTLTLNFPARRFLLSDKNRADLDWTKGVLSWRYRNRVQVEKRFKIYGYHPAPYASAEFFYESKYTKWSTTALYAGCLFPVVKRVEFDTYYVHQNNTGLQPNQDLNQLGLKLVVDVSRSR